MKQCIFCKEKANYKLNGLWYCSRCLDSIKLRVNNQKQKTIQEF